MSFDIEWGKMLHGETYDAVHPEFIRRLALTRRRLWEFNGMDPTDSEGLKAMFRSIVEDCGEKIHVNQPFRCDYGCNIRIGNNFFANFNLTIIDEAFVTIGDNVFIGPNVSIYTACHPLEPEVRNTGVEWAEAVTIGDNVWIGGSATILPGVTIGNNCVVGAGSVVTKDVEANSLVAGNPARFIKAIKTGM
ncbi:MAG: sugar O-acetyltransferase [Muribaculaceae bacterium]|nr:sugar O-acetyltransferase [Muribaculaceae bacterium]